jgi:hypothetical protein
MLRQKQTYCYSMDYDVLLFAYIINWIHLSRGKTLPACLPPCQPVGATALGEPWPPLQPVSTIRFLNKIR